ncbi:MAG TPA: transposase [Mycobacterium sp.]|nr:transposase [Mycobacterium sp.]
MGGVDTHKHTHYAAVIDQHGRLLGHQQFPATDAGYRTLLSWMRTHGPLEAVGVESNGSFGATLTRAPNRVADVLRHHTEPMTGIEPAYSAWESVSRCKCLFGTRCCRPV